MSTSEPTAEEASARLEAEGVDVDGFLARIRERVTVARIMESIAPDIAAAEAFLRLVGRGGLADRMETAAVGVACAFSEAQQLGWKPSAPAPTNTAEAVRAIVARLRADAYAHSERVNDALDRDRIEGEQRTAAFVLHAAADRIGRDHAPSAPVERVWTRAEVLAFGDAAYVNAEGHVVRFRAHLTALLDAPSATAKGER